ncbi:MAG: TlpA family protein disulfide reductase [Mycobacteriales bacterium]
MPRRAPAARLAALVATAALSVLSAGCIGHHAVDLNGTGTGQNFVATGLGGGLLTHRSPAPVLSGRTIEGGYYTTSAARGKVLVVNFWASWCAPCRQETPVLAQEARAYAGRGVEFLGVLFRDSAANGRAFATDDHVPYPSLYDPSGVDLLGFRGLNPTSIPDTAVIDRQGRVAALFIGPVTDSLPQFQHVLAVLAAEPSGAAS